MAKSSNRSAPGNRHRTAAAVLAMIGLLAVTAAPAGAQVSLDRATGQRADGSATPGLQCGERTAGPLALWDLCGQQDQVSAAGLTRSEAAALDEPAVAPASPGSAPAPAGAWSLVPSANASNARAANFLTDVDCPAPDDCWTVGHSISALTFQTLIQHWDGSEWSLVPSPNTSPDATNSLRAIDCLGVDDCWAVGNAWGGANFRNLVLHWDGRSWEIVASPDATETNTNYLADVDCVSSSECWAVGFHLVGPNRSAPTVLAWNGDTWSDVTPSEVRQLAGSFGGLDCAEGTCTAVGSVDSAAGKSPYSISWDGASWTSSRGADGGGVLADVSCVSAGVCWASGHEQTQGAPRAAIFQLTEGAWAADTTFAPAGESKLTGIACIDATECWATGTVGPFGSTRPLVVGWDGTRWSERVSPNPAEGASSLVRPACDAARGCWAAGFVSMDVYQTMIQRWDGETWSRVPTRNRSQSQTNRLGPVTCVADEDCWSVGYFAGSRQQTLIQRWNGRSWDVVPSPNVSSTAHNILTGVACSAPDSCWAVGAHLTTGVAETLILRWDGSHWAQVASPNARVGQHSLLNGIACAGAADCWAVGYSLTGTVARPLFLHWDGTTWSESAAVLTLSDQAIPYGVTCPAADRCWAVGQQLAADGTTVPLYAGWDGTAWVAQAPDPRAEPQVLYSVSCASSSTCWAVGASGAAGATDPLVADWDGDAWTARTPFMRTGEEALLGVSCSADDECRAVGAHQPEGVFQTLVLRWDGAAWSPEASPNFSSDRASVAAGVWCAGANECLATGYHQFGRQRTLAMRYAPVAAEVMPTRLDLSIVGTGSGREIRAVLVEAASGRAVSGVAISFFGNGEPLGIAVTDGAGSAALAAPPRFRGNNVTFQAIFEGSASHGPSEAARSVK